MSDFDPLRSAARARDLDQPAFITVLPDDQIQGFADSAPPGPLAGMPFAIKDNIDLAGVPTTAANPARNRPAASSSTAVGLLLAAGAIPIGKTNLDQYATGLVGTRSPYGCCHSVFSPQHISGGSSSGSAVAVATGVVPFALGTDTAGSGRVPAAFNGLVGLKATRGLISTTGVVPACRSLDCVTVLTPTVALARELLAVLATFDPHDGYGRPAPTTWPRLVGRPRIGIADVELDLDPPHQLAWQKALEHAATIGDLVPVDIEPFLQAAQLLYSGPWLAERSWAFGRELDDSANTDPTVRAIVGSGGSISAEDAFAGMYRLAELRRLTEPVWRQLDVLLLPTTPGHPTLADVAAEPVAVNTRLGRFTNMTNLLDLAAIAVPGAPRPDGLPFGVQFLAPAFADHVLLEIGARWLGEPADTAPTAGTVALAVAGAHLSGQPLNAQLVERGARLDRAATMASGYRMYEVSGPLPRPGVTRVPGHNGATALQVEVWNMPVDQLGCFLDSIAPPLAIGPVQLDDGSRVLGFVCSADGVDEARDITSYGGWRAYLASRLPG